MAAPNQPVLSSVRAVEGLVGTSIPESDEPLVLSWLRAASSAVRSWTGQTISLVEDDELKLWPETLIADIQLPELPVVSIASITGDPDYDFLSNGKLWLRSGCWYSPVSVLMFDYLTLDPITIVYTHGNSEIPDVVDDVVAAKVAGLYLQRKTNPDNVRNESIEGYSVSLPDMPSFALTESEKELLRDFKPTYHGMMSVL